MQTELTRQEVKKIIMSELPDILKADPEVRRFIVDVSKGKFADKENTDDRFDRTLNELRQMREEQSELWEENHAVIREMLDSIKGLKHQYHSTIGALGARWGLDLESSFRNGLRAILEESFPVTVERYLGKNDEGYVFGRPDQVELDLIVVNGLLIICEIKSSMSKADMHTFWRKKEFYESRHNRKASRVMVISPMVDPWAMPVAERLGIEVYNSAVDDTLRF